MRLPSDLAGEAPLDWPTFDAAQVAKAKFPSHIGNFVIYGFETELGEELVAVATENLDVSRVPLVRIHSKCLTGDAFQSARCDCGQQLEGALRRIYADGNGLVIYEMKEGRGIGLVNKIRAYQLQDNGADTVEANQHLGFEVDYRDYRHAVAVLRHFGASSVRLMSNNPAKVQAVERGGIAVVERVQLQFPVSVHNHKYMETKRMRLGHLLEKGV